MAKEKVNHESKSRDSKVKPININPDIQLV